MAFELWLNPLSIVSSIEFSKHYTSFWCNHYNQIKPGSFSKMVLQPVIKGTWHRLLYSCFILPSRWRNYEGYFILRKTIMLSTLSLDKKMITIIQLIPQFEDYFSLQIDSLVPSLYPKLFNSNSTSISQSVYTL